MEKDEPQQNRIQNAENRSGKLFFFINVSGTGNQHFTKTLWKLKALNVEVDFLGNYKEFFLTS
jgi:prephenate dehydratase